MDLSHKCNISAAEATIRKRNFYSRNPQVAPSMTSLMTRHRILPLTPWLQVAMFPLAVGTVPREGCAKVCEPLAEAYRCGVALNLDQMNGYVRQPLGVGMGR